MRLIQILIIPSIKMHLTQLSKKDMSHFKDNQIVTIFLQVKVLWCINADIRTVYHQ